MEDLTGKRFGKIKVISFSHRAVNGKQYHYYWNCIDDDGYKNKIRSSNLKSGAVKSCCPIKEGRKRSNHGRWKGYGNISGQYFNQIKYNAKKRNIPFDLSIKDIWNKFESQNKKCALSGLEIYFPTCDRKADGTASLDRIDSSKPYCINNVQWTHKNYNKSKLQFGLEDYISMCKNVARNYPDRPFCEPYYSETDIVTNPILRNLYDQLHL